MDIRLELDQDAYNAGWNQDLEPQYIEEDDDSIALAKLQRYRIVTHKRTKHVKLSR